MQKKLTLKQRLVDYIVITSFVQVMFLAWLVPFMLFWVRLEWDEFVNWLIVGTIFQMVFNYPIAKVAIKYGPPITRWVKKNV